MVSYSTKILTMIGRTASNSTVNNTQNRVTKCGVGDGVLFTVVIDISRLKLKLFIVLVAILIDIACVDDRGTIDPCTISTIKPFIAVVINISIVCVNGSELLARCISTEMIIILIVLTIIMTSTVAAFIGAVYVTGNVIIETIIIVHAKHSCCLFRVICLSKINPCTITGGLTTTIKQRVAVVITISIICAYGKNLLIIALVILVVIIYITYYPLCHDTTSSKLKLKPFIAYVNVKQTSILYSTSCALTITITTKSFIAVLIAISIVCVNGIGLLVIYIMSLSMTYTIIVAQFTAVPYAIGAAYLYGKQVFNSTIVVVRVNNGDYVIPVTIYPCAIGSVFITLIINEFIELFVAKQTKPLIAEVTIIIVYVNGKVLKPFITIIFNVAVAYVNDKYLSSIDITMVVCMSIILIIKENCNHSRGIVELDSSVHSALFGISSENKTKGDVHIAASIIFLLKFIELLDRLTTKPFIAAIIYIHVVYVNGKDLLIFHTIIIAKVQATINTNSKLNSASLLQC